MQRRGVEAVGVAAAATMITLILALPVLRAPSERIFGAPIVGWHHDPYTVMQQFAHPLSLGLYSQPVTDLTGAALARMFDPVTAYNWLVLASFPLSAAAGYLLAREFALTPFGALAASLLFAFSPFHLAQAAYHPHVAQTEWIALYLLALWRALQKATAFTLAVLIAATVAVTLSNFYGGLIAAVITPLVVGASALTRCRDEPAAARRHAMRRTIATLGGLAIAGGTFVWWNARTVVTDPATLAFARDELFEYSAYWWSYLIPPVSNPVLGSLARRVWVAAGVHDGLLEQQVTLGAGVMLLSAIALHGWLADDRRFSARRSVPVLAIVAFGALVCSLAPERTVFGHVVGAPSAVLYSIVPMFRAYGRFGVVVQLMMALLAGLGIGRLIERGTTHAKAIAAGLAVLAAAEYIALPASLSRDTLPTAAHRWVMQQPALTRVLDCGGSAHDSSSVSWLTHGRIQVLDDGRDACLEPDLGGRVVAAGATYVLVRDRAEGQWLDMHGVAFGFAPRVRFADAHMFGLTQHAVPVYTTHTAGLWPRENDDTSTWRWMGTDASWTVVTVGHRPRVALDIVLNAFHADRRLVVQLDHDTQQTVDVLQGPHQYRLGPFALDEGSHALTFHAIAPPVVADTVLANGDPRALSFAIGTWTWSDQ